VLLNGYSYYLAMLAGEALTSVFGIIAVLLLIAAFVLSSKAGAGKKAGRFFSVASGAVILFLVGFYMAEIEFDERPEQFADTRVDLTGQAEDCGVHESKWMLGSMGMNNPCPNGCLRGVTVSKKMKMKGFPPYPVVKRGVQCWTRDPVEKADYLNMGLTTNVSSGEQANQQ